MERKYTYYIVKGEGPAKAAIDQYNQEYLAYMDHVKKIGDKYGAKQIYQGPYGIIGLLFDNKDNVPAGLMHKKNNPENVYSTNKATKAGKTLAKEFAAVVRPNIHTISRIVKANPVMVEDHRSRTGVALCWPCFEVIGDTYVWVIPVQPSGDLPVMEDLTGLCEIKTSEYWAMKEAAEALA